MKGVVLCGGTGSRLGELTKVTNKHLLPVGDEPMVYHPIRKLVGANICNIMLVTGREHMGDFTDLLGSGKDLGCNLTYKVQDEAGGIAQAISLVEDFVKHDSFVVLLGDNIFQDPLEDLMEEWNDERTDVRIVLKKIPDVEKRKRFGVVSFDGECISCIHEKPVTPPSEYVATGIYMYGRTSQLFSQIRKLKPSDRGELEITDLNNRYIHNMDYRIIDGYWTDAGTKETLHEANRLVRENTPEF